MARCDPLSVSSRSSVFQPSQYTYLHKTTRDMLAFNYFTKACILTSFASDSNSLTVVDHRIHVLAIDFLSYILFLQSLLPRSVSFTIYSSNSEVSSRRRSLHCVLPTQNKLLERAVALPESHSLLSFALRCRCCYWFSMLVLLSFASVTLLVHANCLEVPVFAFSFVEAMILGTDYCRLLRLI